MRTHYAAEFKLKVLVALDANNGNLYEIAKQFDLPRSTVSDWHQHRDVIYEESETLLHERRLHLSQRMELIVNQIVDAMPKKVAQARLADSARALSIMLTLSTGIAAKQAEEAARSSTVEEKLMRLMKRFGYEEPTPEPEAAGWAEPEAEEEIEELGE